MKFFNRNRRSRSKSVDRNAKGRNSSRPREQQAVYQNVKRKAQQQRGGDGGSVGSDLPTLDQFEIAVPSKSFASVSLGDQDPINLPPRDSREDHDADNRSTTDISSITSVSYRAGYYYLRNIKNKAPEQKPKSGLCGSGCLPSCSCAACMPCSCSWLTCCCCAEAKTELATQTNTAITAPLSKNSLLLDQPPRQRDKARKSQSPGRRAMAPPDAKDRRHRQHGVHSNRRSGSSSKRMSSNRRYIMPDTQMDDAGRDSPMYPSVKGNHSLFDELSEEEEMAGYAKRGRQQPQQYQIKGNKKTWLHRRGGATNEPEYSNSGQRARSRSRGRGRR